jgi:hypothetical protein
MRLKKTKTLAPQRFPSSESDCKAGIFGSPSWIQKVSSGEGQLCGCAG